MQRKVKLAIGVAVVLSAGAFVAATHGWANFGGAINARHVDLAAPDAYISTPALSRLPRDLVKAPLARDVLTQDFAFYYEDNDERLALAGTLKRLAFEHDTTIADKLLQLVLDEPAEVALWKDDKGAPRYWLIAMTRGSLAKIAQNAGPLLAGDRQLSEIGDLPGARGATQVMALTLSSRRTVAIVARGDRVVILSDPGLLFDNNRQIDSASAKTVAALLSSKPADQGLYRRRFGLGVPGADHVLLADSSLLAFGYRHFFPGLQAVQFDIAPGGATVRTQLRVADAKALPTVPVSATLWSGVPMGAAACSWLPADWSQARALLDGAAEAAADAAAKPVAEVEAASEPASAASSGKKATKAAKIKVFAKPGADPKAVWDQLVANLDGPAAVCWYARSQMHTPLLVAHLRAGAPPAAVDQGLEQLADWLMPGDALEQPRPRSATAPRRWQRDVNGLYGFVGRDSDYRPTLARAGAWVTFSPDDKLVDLALSTQERRYPSVGDTLPTGAPTLAVVAPKQVADLLQREAFAVLPAQQELFHQAAVTHLVPRLDALRRWPDVHAAPVGAPSAQGWVEVVWTSVVAPAPAPDAPGAAPAIKSKAK
jgi:uncharacterized protein YfaA (DUF2138 family)